MKPANDNAQAQDEAERTGKPCPVCGKPSIPAMAPFCSKRCADVDLHRWLGGHYAIPTADSQSADDDDAS